MGGTEVEQEWNRSGTEINTNGTIATQMEPSGTRVELE